MTWSRKARVVVVTAIAGLAACESTPQDDDPSTEGDATTTPAEVSDGPAEPTIHEPLAALVPPMPGIELSPAEAVDWGFYDLPPGTLAWAAGVSGPEGAIGRLVIAEGTGQVPLVPTYVNTIFTEGVPFVGVSAPEDTPDSGSDGSDGTEVPDVPDGTEASGGTGASDGTGVSDGTDTIETSDDTDGTDGTEASDETDGIQATNRVEATESTVGTQATDRIEAPDGTESSDETDGTDPTGDTEAPDGTESSGGTDDTQASDGTDESDGTEASDVTDSSEVPDVAEARLRPAWRAMGDAAVAVATVDAGGLGAWIWEDGGRIWIMRGRLDTGAEYVEQLLAATGAGEDPYDHRILSFTLRDRLVDVPGYQHVDVPRADVLGQLPNTLAGSCTESIHLGYVVTEDDPDPQTRQPDDLGLYVSTVSGICDEAGFMDDLVAALDDQEDLRQEQLGGQDVYRGELEVIAIDGGQITHFLAEEPATIAAMEPFIEAFLTAP